MAIAQTVLLGIALSADAFVVAASISLLGNFKAKNALILSTCFALVQASLFSLGFFIGDFATKLALEIFPYIGFFLLSVLGIIAIKNGLEKDTCNNKPIKFNNPLTLLILSISISIDALIAGLPYPIISKEGFQSFIIIALTTFIITLIATMLSINLKHKCKLYTLAGIALIIIGLSLLF
ncbi:MAG: manganese efflux pump [Opitutales bacterium]